jgi:hypothetical protein
MKKLFNFFWLDRKKNEMNTFTIAAYDDDNDYDVEKVWCEMRK